MAFGHLKHRNADRFGWGKVGMRGYPQAMPFGRVTPTMINAGKRFAPHKAMRQAHAAMRTTVFIGVDLSFTAHGENVLLANLKAATAGISQFRAAAKKLHVYPQVPKAWANGECAG